MAKFNVGDKVRRTGKRFGNFHTGDTGVVAVVAKTGSIRFDGDRHFYLSSEFELVSAAPCTVPSLPLTTVLQMDREIAKAGGSVDLLNSYLDRPLSEFVQNVMAPNRLKLVYCI